MQKDAAFFAACQGNAPTTDGGKKLWMAWERGMLGATRPDSPVDSPEPFRREVPSPRSVDPSPATLVVKTEEHQALLDNYRRAYSYPPIECADLSNAVRHLTFHVWPVAGFGAWQWNCDRLMEHADLFNGRRIVAIATSKETDSADSVKDYLQDFTDEFIVIKNDNRLREVATWVPMLKKLEEYRSESDVTFSCHAKSVRHRIVPGVEGSTLFDWTSAMYETCLQWGAVLPLLEEFATVGSFRRLQSHMTGRGGFGPWHYSGSFYWWRNRDAFRRNWRYTPNQFFGTEAWPGIMFEAHESGVLFSDKTGDLYDKSYFDSEIRPALDLWKMKHMRMEVERA
jgi:hypothetical protein